MVGTMKKTIGALIAALVLSLALASNAWAATDPSATVDLQVNDSKGIEVTVKDYDKLTDITSLQLALDVASLDGGIAYIEPTFQFSSFVDAKVKTYTLTTIGDTIRVKLYVAGVEATGGLFPASLKDSGVNLGTLSFMLKDNMPADAKVSVQVTVPTDGTSFDIVSSDYSTMAMPQANINAPESPTVTLSLADRNNGSNGSNGSNGGNGGNGSDGANGGDGDGDGDGNGGDDGDGSGGGSGGTVGDSGIDVNSNIDSSSNNANVDAVGKTSDTKAGQTPPTGDNLGTAVTGIVIAIIVVVALIVVLIVVRRRRNTASNENDKQ